MEKTFEELINAIQSKLTISEEDLERFAYCETPKDFQEIIHDSGVEEASFRRNRHLFLQLAVARKRKEEQELSNLIGRRQREEKRLIERRQREEKELIERRQREEKEEQELNERKAFVERYLAGINSGGSVSYEYMLNGIQFYEEHGLKYPVRLLRLLVEHDSSLEELLKRFEKHYVPNLSAPSSFQRMKTGAREKYDKVFKEIAVSDHFLFHRFVSFYESQDLDGVEDMYKYVAANLFENVSLGEAYHSSRVSLVLNSLLEMKTQRKYHAVHQQPLNGTVRTKQGSLDGFICTDEVKESSTFSVDIGIVLLNPINGDEGLTTCIEVKTEKLTDGGRDQLLVYAYHICKNGNKVNKTGIIALGIDESSIQVYGVFVYVTKVEEAEQMSGNDTTEQIGYCKLFEFKSHETEKIACFLKAFVENLDKMDSFDHEHVTPSTLQLPILGEDTKVIKKLNDKTFVVQRGDKEKCDSICKIYDYRGRNVCEDQRRHPNAFIITSCLGETYLGSIEVLCCCEDVTILCYEKRCGDTYGPKSLKQFTKICRDISLLHEKGYVHGDVRCANIVFGSKESGNAWLIDFDFSGKVGRARYPVGWSGNDCIFERHPDANAGKPLEKCHDRYSLGVLLQYFFLSSDVISSFADRIQNTAESLNVIADAMEERACDIHLDLTDKTHKAIFTGSPIRG
eukprot:TRINITY_DN909_c0_g2_i1.p1 TRINITY_DN909_c0_g2~~TRINITY_DN909_c0_g2_i1.p1  ORF type:complete len:698 (+),score=164.79 TRINITY_DN909_c0_g2_i1:48-2096(+)